MMDKAATIHIVLHIAGNDEAAHDYGKEAVTLAKDIVEAGISVIGKSRWLRELPAREFELIRVEEIKGGDDNSGD